MLQGLVLISLSSAGISGPWGFFFCCFQIPSPISASLTHQLWPFSFTSSSLVLSNLSYEAAHPLSQQLLLSSILPLPLLVCISVALLMVLCGILLAVEQHMLFYECLHSEWVTWGALWALGMFVYPMQVFICTAGSRGTGAEGAWYKWLEKLSMNSLWSWSCLCGVCVILSTFVVQPKKGCCCCLCSKVKQKITINFLLLAGRGV